MVNEQDQTDKEVWLTLKVAAAQLAVHPTTLRRWANQGRVACVTTPGGHRRFQAEEIKRVLQRSGQVGPVATHGAVWAKAALDRTRQAISNRPEQTWLVAHQDDEALRAQTRQWGRQLMGLTMKFIAAEQDGEAILMEAEVIGDCYAQHCRQLGLPLTEALQAVLFFRDTLVETVVQLPAAVQKRPEANVHLMRRINTLLNRVHLAIARVYETQGLEGIE